jgi:hypothetical protein
MENNHSRFTPEGVAEASQIILQDGYVLHTYIHRYHSRFIPEGVAEVSQIFLRDIHVLPNLVSNEEHCRRDRW